MRNRLNTNMVIAEMQLAARAVFMRKKTEEL